MDKRTSQRLAKLAGRVLETGKASPAEVRQLAASVLAQTGGERSERAAPETWTKRHREIVATVNEGIRRGLIKL